MSASWNPTASKGERARRPLGGLLFTMEFHGAYVFPLDEASARPGGPGSTAPSEPRGNIGALVVQASTAEPRRDAVALNLESRRIAAAIEEELDRALDGLSADVRIHFRDGSLVWSGLVAFFALAGGVGATVQTFQYAHGLLGWCVDHVMGKEIQRGILDATEVRAFPAPASSEPTNGADAAQMTGGVAIALGVLAVAVSVAALALARG